MGEKKVPDIMMLGAEQNETYMEIVHLHEKRTTSIQCYRALMGSKMERWKKKKLIWEAERVDLVLIIIGSVEEYRYFKPVAKALKDRCILIFDTFEGRMKCLRKKNKNLLVMGEGKIGGIVSELLNIMIFDASIMVDYRDIFQSAGWRTEVRNEVFSDALEAVKKGEINNMKMDEKKEISLLWKYGELDPYHVIKITNMVWCEGKEHVFGASYEERHGYGMFTFLRDVNKSKKPRIQIENPLKKHPVKCLAAICGVLALICITLGMRLISLQNARKKDGALNVMGKSEDCGVEIRTVKAALTDEEGREVARCENDVVTVYGTEYELVGQAIEAEIPLKDMQGTLEMLQQFGRGSKSVSRLECRRLDGKIISFKEKGHYYTGGSGLLSTGYTFSVEEGRRLELEDILADEEGFYEEIDALIKKALSEHPDITEFKVDYEKRYDELYTIKDRLPGWLLSVDGMTFLFEQGDFLAMAFGCLEVTVPYEDIEKYIRKEYR